MSFLWQYILLLSAPLTMCDVLPCNFQNIKFKSHLYRCECNYY